MSTGVASTSFSQNSSGWNLSPTLLFFLFAEVHQLLLLKERKKERKKGSDESTHSQRAEAYSAATTRLYSIISTCAIYPWLRNIYVVNFIKSTTVSCLNGSYFIKKHIFENIAFRIEISDAHIFSEEQGSCRGAWGNLKFL